MRQDITGDQGKRSIVRLSVIHDCARCFYDGAERAAEVYQPGLLCTLPRVDESRWTGELVADHAEPHWPDDDPVARTSEAGCAGGWYSCAFVESLAPYRPVVRSGGMIAARRDAKTDLIVEALCVLDAAAAATSAAFSEEVLR